MAAHEIRIDQSRTLTDEPGAGHNRWHPDIPPILTIEPGDEVLMETRDGGDLQISRSSTLDETSCGSTSTRGMRSTAAATTPPPDFASSVTARTAPRTSISRPGTRSST